MNTLSDERAKEFLKEMFEEHFSKEQIILLNGEQMEYIKHVFKEKRAR